MAAAVAAWMGLVLGARMDVAATSVAMFAAVGLGLLGVRAPDRLGTLLLLASMALAGAARAGGAHARLVTDREGLAADGAFHRIRARLIEPPRRESGEPNGLAAIESASPPLARGAIVRLRLPEGCGAEWGDRLEALARLEAPLTVRNPGGFDALAAADAAGVAGGGRAFTAVVEPAHGLAGWVRAGPMRWRRAIELGFARGLSADARELVTPLVIGDRSAMTPELDARFRASGLVHLLALSGLHVAWLATLARALAGLIGAGVRGRALVGGACAVFYASLSGPLPSLMRAVATELVAAVARLTQRALDPMQALAVSALGLLVAWPSWAHDLGFQLSCAATLGLLSVGPWLEERAGRARRVLAPFTPTLSAQLTAAPLLLARFHALPWTGLFANLLAVPVSGLLLAAAWLAAAGECVLPGSGAPWLHACEALGLVLRAIVKLATAAPLALLPTGSEPAIAPLAGLGAAALAIALPAPRAIDARLRRITRARFVLALAGAMASVLAWTLALTARELRPPRDAWWLVAVDVGQGDALALAFADGWWLVDAGPRSPRWDAGEGAVLPFLRWAGVRRLRTLALTHDDGDHTGGAGAVRRSLPVERVLASNPLPGVAGPAARFGARTVARGDTLRRSPLVVARWPPRPDAADSAIAARGDNAAGLVLEVGEGEARVLLTADADSVVEAALAFGTPLALLKVGHHGSGSSSGASFLARARPRRATISVGRRNAYGHPHPGALARLTLSGAALDRTDREGCLWYEVSDAGVRKLDWRAGRRAVARFESRAAPRAQP